MSGDQRFAGAAVLVTGAQGFIGSWLTGRLLDEGARVIVPRRAPPPGGRFESDRLDERCELVELDLLDLTSVVRALNEMQVEVVFHLAAQTIVGTANDVPLATFETNTRGTYSLLEAARLVGTGRDAPRVVVGSSYHAYGGQGDMAYTEELGLRPTYPYDVSKACADMLARCYAATYGMPVAVTRLANVYGGGDLNFSRLVPQTAQTLVAGERPAIHSDGTPERDYLYVEDAVEAYLAVASSLESPELRGRAWNAGADVPVAVVDVVRQLIAASGQDLEPEVEGRANPRDEIDRQYLDSTAIQEELGWSPSWALAEGLRETYGWYERALA